MGRKIERVTFSGAPIPTLKNVAAYARVSSGKDEMLHSLSSQISYYRDLIQSKPGWRFAGVYADEALTGTRENRENFQRLLADCRAGRVDKILTKSISRFARNTVTLLETVRELKGLGIDVFFEEQNIHTMGSDGELLLTILASYAQEESRSASENQKWRVKRNFEEGIPWRSFMLGYRVKDGRFEIVPEEAAIVRRIFDDYLAGAGFYLIAKRLNEEGVPNPSGAAWIPSAIQKLVRNVNYTGNLLLQKTYSENHITKKMRPNRGELPQYYVENAHEAIIEPELFMAVQEEIARRSAKFNKPDTERKVYPFTGLIECSLCGRHYRRKTTACQAVWICSTFNTRGKKYCPSKQIPETTLERHTALVTDDIATIEKIQAAPDNTLIYYMVDGSIVTQRWADRSRTEAWSPEMREAARAKSLAQGKEMQ